MSPAAGAAPPGAGQASQAGALVQALEWLFDRVTALPDGTGAKSDREIDRLIRIYTTGAGAAGFLTNLGGVLTLPVALPANLVGVAAIQLKLIAAIAAARGHDVHSEEVRTLGIACLTGGTAIELLKKAGIQVGERLGQRAVAGISGAVLARVNQAVGFSLLAKAGSQGVVNLTKIVPILGGLVGGGIDAASTRAVGAIAKRVFPTIEPLPPPRLSPGPAPELIA